MLLLLEIKAQSNQYYNLVIEKISRIEYYKLMSDPLIFDTNFRYTDIKEYIFINQISSEDDKSGNLKNDTIKIKVYIVDGVKVKCVNYDTDQNVMREVSFNKNGKDGFDVLFYSNGKIRSKSFYVDGVLNGPSITYFEDGKVSNVISNKPLEIIQEWYPNGNQKKLIIPYNLEFDSAGYLEQEWYSNGFRKSISAFNSGVQPFKMYYENGNLAIDGYILNGPWYKVGIWKEWYSDGKIKCEYSYELTNDPGMANSPTGIWISWDENGKIIEQKNY